MTYLANDGTPFTDYNECRQYEEDLASRKGCGTAIAIILFFVAIAFFL